MAVSIVFQDAQPATGTHSSYTRSLTVSSAVGQERLVAIAAVVNDATVGDISTVTVDGQTATRVGTLARGGVDGNGFNPILTFWRAPGTSGTTINVVATINTGTGLGAYFALWTLNDALSFKAWSKSIINDPTLSLATVTDGAVAAAYLGYSDTSGTPTTAWTGLTESFDDIRIFNSFTDIFSGASANVSVGESLRAISANITGDVPTFQSGAGMAVSFGPDPDPPIFVATDDFNRTDGGLGSNWTTATGFDAPQILSHHIVAFQTASHAVACWNADMFQDDQFSEITIVDDSINLGVFIGPTLRHQAGASNSFYVAYVSAHGSATAIFRWTAGSAAQIASQGGLAWDGGDVVRFQVTGNLIELLQNGTVVVSVTDNDFTSGSPGYDIYTGNDATTTGLADNWRAGPLTAITTTVAVDSGSFVKSGQNVAFALRSPAARGTIALNGQNVTQIIRAAIARGTIALNGQNVIQEIHAAIARGAFVLNGQSIRTAALTRFPANTGDFVFAGQDVEFEYLFGSVVFVPGVGVFMLEGQNVITRVIPLFSPLPGIVVMQGRLQNDRLLSGRSEVIILEGNWERDQ